MDKYETIKKIVEEKTVRFPNKTQLAIAVIKNGNPNFYGFKIENNNIISVQNENKIFEIGSITKVFTSTVLADLVVKNKINLDTDIQEYFDFSLNENTKISLLSLANHTSGLKSHPSNYEMPEITAEKLRNLYREYNEDMLIDYLQNEIKIPKTEEKKFEYSNLGFGLLGYALGLSQNRPFKELMQEIVFNKYKMTNTYVDRSNLKNEFVTGLDKNGNETENWDMDILAGCGVVLSSVSDLSKFVSAHFDEANKELALTRKATITVDDEMKVGLGLGIITTSDNNIIYWHNGGTGGYKSAMEFDMETKTASIVLSNVSFFNPNHWDIDRICTRLTGLNIKGK
ncbi:MAG: beta-lactamase family protein [Candidatus Delongbacteria bacterium]|nr:beta-lactamase family protein [Candidatus Delongbacteria bacterium]MBN2835460.1 beta-lactamase family protein [Candidatus Delongbacteria bacterium]